jgi:hypothetical protein
MQSTVTHKDIEQKMVNRETPLLRVVSTSLGPCAKNMMTNRRSMTAAEAYSPDAASKSEVNRAIAENRFADESLPPSDVITRYCRFGRDRVIRYYKIS